MSRRVVRAIAAGTIIDIVRLAGNNGNGNGGNSADRTSVTNVTPPLQAGEEFGILINVLSQDANNYLLAQYVYIFPTTDWVRQGGATIDLPEIADYPAGTTAEQVAFLRGNSQARSYNYVNLASVFLGRVATGTPVQQGDELGFYAQIGRSTLPQGPHLHISLFTLPTTA